MTSADHSAARIPTEARAAISLLISEIGIAADAASLELEAVAQLLGKPGELASITMHINAIGEGIPPASRRMRRKQPGGAGAGWRRPPSFGVGRTPMDSVELVAAAEKLEAAAAKHIGEVAHQLKDRADQLRSDAFNLLPLATRAGRHAG
jgi:hypothetical protein